MPTIHNFLMSNYSKHYLELLLEQGFGYFPFLKYINKLTLFKDQFTKQLIKSAILESP